MKRGRLPLTALRSFESAGRHLSFSRAAEELYVSQAAISRQVRELEALLGAQLFRRLHRRVELTDAGSELLTELTRNFDQIAAALDQIGGNKARNVVRLSLEPALAACWLMPRIGRFQAQNPEIRLELIVDPRVIDFRTGEADLGLRFSRTVSQWPHAEAALLIDAYETPMLSKAMARELTTSERPSDLLKRNLLHEETRQDWQDWFRLAGVSAAQIRAGGPLLADPAITRQAALLGHGVALGDLFLFYDEVESGDLVIPFDILLKVGAYWIATQHFDALSPAAQAVAGWLKAEAHAARVNIDAILARPAA